MKISSETIVIKMYQCIYLYCVVLALTLVHETSCQTLCTSADCLYYVLFVGETSGKLKVMDALNIISCRNGIGFQFLVFRQRFAHVVASINSLLYRQ